MADITVKNPMLGETDVKTHPVTSNVKRFRLCRKNKASLICFGVLFVIGVVAITTVAILRRNKTTKQLHGRFGIVFDVGGSGTRMHIYEFRENKGMEERLSVKCEGEGATHQPDNVLKEKLMKCLEQAKMSIPNREIISTVPVYMGASAGMRLLKYDDEKRYDHVLNSLRRILNNSTFAIKYADTITGHEEGLFSWMTVNYLLGKQLPKNLIEVGSTSFQFAFEMNGEKQVNKVEVSKVDIFGDSTHVFSTSRLCYGIKELRRRYYAQLLSDSTFTKHVNDPCSFDGFNITFPSTYFLNASCITGKLARDVFGTSLTMKDGEYTFRGNGSFDRCFNQLNKTLSGAPNKMIDHKRLYKNFAGVGGGTYFGSTFLGLPNPVLLSDYEKVTRKLCGTSYQKLQKWKGFNKFSSQYCLADSYTYYLLKNIVGLESNATVDFLRKINGISLSWPFGMMLNYKDEMSASLTKTQSKISKGTFVTVLVISICLLIASILAMIIFLKVLFKQKKSTMVLRENGA